MALVLYYKDILEKETLLLYVTKRNQLNAAHAQLLKKLRPIAFAKT